MKHLFRVLAITLILTTYSFAQDNNHVPGEIIVMLKYGDDVNKLSNSFGFMGLTVKEPVVEYMNIWLLKFDNNRVNGQTVLNEVRKHSSVSVAQFNHYVSDRSVTPNDTRFAEM